MNKLYSRIKPFILSIICLTIMLCSRFLPTAEATRTVRVGYIDYPGFIELAYGQFQGYGVEYLAEVESSSNLHFVYVHDTWANCLKRILAGDIDMVCTAQKTTDRLEKYGFSKYPVGVEATIIYARQNDEDISFEEFNRFNGKRIGMLKSSFQNEVYPAYEARHNFHCQPVMFDDETSMMQALSNGQVDLALAGSLAKHSDHKIVGEFGADPFFFMARKDDAELINTLNDAQDKLQVNKPYFTMELYNKWYGKNTGLQMPNFTRAEIEFIKTAPEIKVGVKNDLPPMMYQEENGKKLTGVIPDIMKLITQKSGLKFKYVEMPNNAWLVNEVTAGKVDLAVGAKLSSQLLDNNQLRISNPYFDGELVGLVRRGDNINGKEKIHVGSLIGVKSLEKILASRYKDPNPRSFTSAADGLNALVSKEIDVFVFDRLIANRMMQNPRYSDRVTIMPDFVLADKQCLAANAKNTNPLLISILNKTIATIGTNDFDKIIIAHTVANPYNATLPDLAYKYRYSLFVVLLLLVGCLAMFFYSSMVRSSAMKNITESNNHLKEVAAMATRASEAKSLFLSSMSHDIRTPLNAIIGLTTLAQEEYGSKDRGIKEYLNKVFVASKTLLGIVNNVLDMSAIENNEMKLTNEKFNLLKMLQDTVSVYSGECQRRNITLTTDFTGVTDSIVIGDATKLNRIIDNIMSNAYKFTARDGSIIFTVQEKIHDEDSLVLSFSIKDTGSGMSKEMQERMFTPFAQEADSRLLKNGGTGLGMSIAKNMVTLMRGDIHFESKLGEGTTFFVNVLLGRTKQTVEETHNVVVVKHNYDFGDKCMLLAEDNDINAEIAAKLLKRVNLRLELVTDGLQAVEKVKEHLGTDYYAGVLMDIQMPNMNGLEAAKAIRKLETGDMHIPILAMTANAFADDIVATAAAGMDAHIAKPIDKEHMYETIAKYVKNNADEG